MIRRTPPLVAVLLAALVVVVAACSSDSTSESKKKSDDASNASSTTRAPAPTVLEILVTNDDGVAAPGIDVVAHALAELDGVKVTVVAPAANQSGSGSKTTPGTLSRDRAEHRGRHERDGRQRIPRRRGELRPRHDGPRAGRRRLGDQRRSEPGGDHRRLGHRRRSQDRGRTRGSRPSRRARGAATRRSTRSGPPSCSPGSTPIGTS